jgi:hypothetical protein
MDDEIVHLQLKDKKKPESNFNILMYVFAIIVVIWILTLSCATCSTPLP